MSDDDDEYDEFLGGEPKLRTSTKAGIAAIISGVLVYWLPIVEYIIPQDLKAWVIPLIMYVTARYSRTPINPGKI